MVDALVRDQDFERFVSFCDRLESGETALLVTPHVDDEKPLYVDVDSEGFIHGFSAEPIPTRNQQLITSGIYCLNPGVFEDAKLAALTNMNRVRGFLSFMIERGTRMRTFVVDKTIDVDRPEDLAQAQSFLVSGLLQSGST